ncbi:MAG: acyl-CoA dehydrogenase family protein [Anaerolineae bacterium]
MDFKFSAEQEIFRRTVATFVEKNVIPRVEEMEEKEGIPADLFHQVAEMGFFGLRYPEKYGGQEGDMVTFCILCEELARGYLSLAAAVAMQGLMGTNFIYRFGSEEQRQQLLVPAIRGEKFGTIAMSEPGCGSDLGAITTTAVRDGDQYVLNGTKMWITAASRADFFTVAAKTDPEAGFKGIDMFLVEKGAPGLKVGKKIEKVGVQASETCELILDNVRVPAENLFGEQEGTGFANLRQILNDIRVMTGALGLGLARAAYEDSLQYANQREAFGRPIIKFQAIQHKLADMVVDIEASRLLVYYAAWLLDQKLPCNKEAAVAKLYATEAAVKAADEATRIYGAYGMAMDLSPQRYFRDARFLLYGGGTSEIIRNIIASEIRRG